MKVKSAYNKGKHHHEVEYRKDRFLDIFLDLTRKKQPKDEELEEL
jgi:hypothetical protein